VPLIKIGGTPVAATAYQSPISLPDVENTGGHRATVAPRPRVSGEGHAVARSFAASWPSSTRCTVDLYHWAPPRAVGTSSALSAAAMPRMAPWSPDRRPASISQAGPPVPQREPLSSRTNAVHGDRLPVVFNVGLISLALDELAARSGQGQIQRVCIEVPTAPTAIHI
jgi:hypothetical protein